MERHRFAAFSVLLALTTAGSIAAAQAAPAPQASTTTAAAPAAPAPADSTPNFFKDVQANAFVSFGYLYNFNRTPDQSVGLRFFDSRSNTFSLDGAEFVLQKAVAKPNDIGFRVDLVAGSALAKAQAAGLSLGANGDLQQAFVSYVAPLGTGMRFDMGKFVTHHGYEVIEGYDGYNDNYSRSLLFNYAIPLTHTGVKASYAINSMASATVMLVNGWDNAVDNNASKTIGAQLALTPAPPLSIFLNYMGGPEKTDTNGFVRHLGDFVATYKVSDEFSLGLNADYATEKGASLVKSGDDATWGGVAGYARFGPATGLSVGLRAETFKDNGGTRLGTGTKITANEFTITPTYKFSSNFVVRAEGRYDSGDSPIFTDDKGKPTKNQATLGINTMFIY